MDDRFGTSLYARSANDNVRSTISRIPINSIQQFLTTFAVSRVIIIPCSSDLTLAAFASVEAEEAETGTVYSPRSRNSGCSSRIAVIAVSRFLGYESKTSPTQSLHMLLCGNNRSGKPPTADRVHIAGHLKDH